MLNSSFLTTWNWDDVFLREIGSLVDVCEAKKVLRLLRLVSWPEGLDSFSLMVVSTEGAFNLRVTGWARLMTNVWPSFFHERFVSTFGRIFLPNLGFG